MTWTLLLSFLACPRDQPQDSGVEDSGFADTGDTGDSGTQDPDCTVGSLWPLTTSWNGGETIDLEVDCADAGDLEDAQVLVDGKEVETWSTEGGVAFKLEPGAQAAFGVSSVSLSIRQSRGMPGPDLRFRVDPSELEDVVRTQGSTPFSDTVNNVLGISEQAQMLFWQKDGQLQFSTTFAGSLQSQETGLDLEEVVVDNGTFSGRYGAGAPVFTTQFKSSASEAMLVPTLDATNDRLMLALATQGAKGFSVQQIPLYFESIGQHKIDAGMEAEQAPVLYDAEMAIDESGALLALTVLVGINATQDKPSAALASYSYSAKGGGVWVRNWQWSASTRVAFAGPIQSGEGRGGTVVLAEEEDKDKDKTPMLLFLLNENGEIGIQGHLGSAGDNPTTVTGAAAPDIQGKTGGLILISHNGEGNMADYLVRTDGFESVTVDQGDLRNVPELQDMTLRTSTDGSVHLYMRQGRAGWDGVQAPSVLSKWTWNTEKGWDTSLSPSVQVLSTGGDTVVAGSANDAQAAAPSVWLDMDGGRWLGDGELSLCSVDDWSLRTQDGCAIITLPGGEEMDLAVDPTAPLSCLLMQGTFVVLGTVDGKSGLVTADSSGTGQASFKRLRPGRWTHIAISHESRSLSLQTDSVGVLGDSISDEGAWELSLGALNAGDLPGAGESTELDLGESSWAYTAPSAAKRGGPSFWLKPSSTQLRVRSGAKLAPPKGDVLASLSENQLMGDRVAVLPNGNAEGCTLSTYYIPGNTLDPAQNMAAAVEIGSSTAEDCSDLPLPLGAADLDGEGQGTLILGSTQADGSASIQEVVFDGAALVALPTVSVPAFDQLSILDLDGDGLDEIILSFATPYGSASGMVLRSQGVSLSFSGTAWSGEELAAATLDGEGLYGEEVGGDALALRGIGVQRPLSPVFLSSWAVMLD
ncbi:MAG: hypothetical protein ACI9VR_000040 [Cognaticolwellia sp.]|jgi:hypothetical protein